MPKIKRHLNSFVVDSNDSNIRYSGDSGVDIESAARALHLTQYSTAHRYITHLSRALHLTQYSTTHRYITPFSPHQS